MFDRIVAGGSVYDGRGGDPIRADIGIRDGRIEAIEQLDAAEGPRTDANGLCVAPGFVDLHGHSDASLVIEPDAQSLVSQGVTSQLVGNCGASVFPLEDYEAASKFDSTGVSREWSTAQDYFRRLEANPPRINVASLVGFGTARWKVLRENADRPADARERALIVREVEAALAAGAAGVSLGLHFAPDLHADRDELVAVCTAASQAGAVVAVHLRDYGPRLGPAIHEAVSLAQQTDARLHVSLLHAFGRSSWGAVPAALDQLDAARDDGVEVSCEFLLWPTVGAWDGWRATLEPELYDWTNPDWAALRGMARDPAGRDRLARAVEDRRHRPKSGFYEEYLSFSDWRDVSLEEAPEDSAYSTHIGFSLAEIASRTGFSEVDVLLDLLADRPDGVMLLHTVLSDADLVACVQWPHAYLGLDAVATRRSRISEPWNTMQIHPRHFGGTARLFSEFVRKRHVLTPAEAVHRLTGGPASVLRWTGRGTLGAGAAADLVLFDADRFGPSDRWSEPATPVVGLNTVMVAGVEQRLDGQGEIGGPMAGSVVRGERQ